MDTIVGSFWSLDFDAVEGWKDREDNTMIVCLYHLLIDLMIL
jgi:hypothetical protein